MKIYFVRHGESEGNADPKYRGENPLTEKGHAQALAVANRFKAIPIEAIIETSKIRSKQTAKAIHSVTNAPISESDLFLERRGEFEIMWEYRHLSMPEITEAMRKHLEQDDWTHENQETFLSIKDRARQALAYIEKLPYENVAIVSHSMFLKVLAAHVILGESLSEEQAILFTKNLRMSNTGLTLFQFNSENEIKWKVVTWNDLAHLG